MGGSAIGFDTVISNGIGVTLYGDDNDNVLVGGDGRDIIYGFGGNDTLIGGQGDDEMYGGDGIDTVDYSGSTSRVIVNLADGTADDGLGGTDTLVGMENVIGSAYDDIITGDALNNVITGGGGDDTLAGGGGDDTYKFGNASGADVIVEEENEGADTLDFAAVTGALTFTVGGLTVTGSQISVTHADGNLENLIGGQGDDTFRFTDGSSLAGRIDGDGGNDVVDFTAFTTAREIFITGLGATDGFKIAEAAVTGGLDNINRILGGSGVEHDRLVGMNQEATWTLNGSLSSYAAGGRSIRFGQMEELDGGTGADTFIIVGQESGSLFGNAGNDTVIFRDHAVLAGEFDGGAGTDTLSFSGAQLGVAIGLTGLGDQDGFDASVTGAGVVANVNQITGGAGVDSLTGLESGVWQINAGLNSYGSGGASLVFQEIDGLLGGGGDDTFAFADGATLVNGAGTVDGGTGLNTLDYSAYSAGVTVDLGLGAATGLSLVSNVSDIAGGQGFDTLTGDAGDNRITANGGGGLLTGGDGDDTYVFSGASGQVEITEEEDGGADTLDLSGVSGDLVISADGSLIVSGQSIEITHQGLWIESVLGGSGVNTLSFAGSADDHTVTLTGLGTQSGFKARIDGQWTLDNVNALIGGDGVDTLEGLDSVSQWTLDNGSDTYASQGKSLSFSGFETISGGTEADAFTLKGAEALDINGNAGDDLISFGNGATLTGEIDGGAGADTVSFAADSTARSVLLAGAGSTDGVAGAAGSTGLDNIDVLAGGGGADSLTGCDSDAAWAVARVNGASTYSTGGQERLSFSGFEALTGGGNADNFVLATDVSFTGSLDGGAGADTLSFANFTSGRNVALGQVSANGFAGSETAVSGGFGNMDAIIGSGAAGGDTLTGMDAAATWTLAAGTYESGGGSLDFAGFETLTGGAGADLFLISGVQTFDLKGGAGGDTFRFANAAELDGTIQGGLPHGAAGVGGDTLDYQAYDTEITVNFQTGQASHTQGIASIENFIGGSNINRITGDDNDNIIIGGPSDDVLIGGKGNDTYIFTDGWGNDTVVEEAGEGTDTYDFSGITAATGNITFTITNGGFQAVADSGDTVGHAGGQVENIIGGDFGNAFIVQGDAEVTGSIKGGSGHDTLDLTQAAGGIYASGISISLSGVGANGFSGAATGVAGGFSDLNEIKGSGNDELTALNMLGVWSINGADSSYTVNKGTADERTLDFSGFTVLNAGSMADAFEIIGGQTGQINGGGGNDTFALADGASLDGGINGGTGTDTLDYSAWDDDVEADLATGGASGIGNGDPGKITGIENLTGGAGNDTLIGDAGANYLQGNDGNDVLVGGYGGDTINGGAGDDAMAGGMGDDTYVFTSSFGADDVITEEDNQGADTINFSAVGDDLTIDLSSVIVTQGGNKLTHHGGGIDLFISGGGNDTFNVNADQDIDLRGGDGDDRFNFMENTTFTGNVDAGDGDDSFVFSDGASIIGNLQGGAGSDSLVFSAVSTGRHLVLDEKSTTDGFGGTVSDINGRFANINSLTGSGGVDTLQGMDAASTWTLGATSRYSSGSANLNFTGFETLQGGSGNDRFEISGNRTFDLYGGAGDDTFAFGDGAKLTGFIGGETGNNTLDFSAFTTARTLWLTGLGTDRHGFQGQDSSLNAALDGSFDNITGLIGSSDPNNSDNIIGVDFDGTWSINETGGTYSVNPTMSFQGFESLTGGDGKDKFNVSGIPDVDIAGGDGDDTVVFAAGAGIRGAINGQGGNDTLEYSSQDDPTVDYENGIASGVLGGISNIDSMSFTPLPPDPVVPDPVVPNPVTEETITSEPTASTPETTTETPVVATPAVETATNRVDIYRPSMGVNNTGHGLAGRPNNQIENIVIPVQSDERVYLNRYNITILALENQADSTQPVSSPGNMSPSMPLGDRDLAIFGPESAWEAWLSAVEKPAGLESLGYEFVSGMKVDAVNYDESEIFISFVVPPELANQELVVLYWNDSANNGKGAWVELTTTLAQWDPEMNGGNGGWHNMPSSYFDRVPAPSEIKTRAVASIKDTGTFLLVKKSEAVRIAGVK